MIFVTPQDTDNRFVIYMNTSVCKVFYNRDGLCFESSPAKIEIMKDFFMNYGVKDIEIKDYQNVSQIVVHDLDILMQIEDTNNITGLKVPILTII